MTSVVEQPRTENWPPKHPSVDRTSGCAAAGQDAEGVKLDRPVSIASNVQMEPEKPTATRSDYAYEVEIAKDRQSDGDDDGGGPSVHDIKRALKQNFVNTGVINDVTARLRSQFVCELRRTGLGVPGARQAVASYRSREGISLRERVLHSLVVDHLASNGLLQSLAVFLPESGLGTVTSTTAAAGVCAVTATVNKTNFTTTPGAASQGNAARAGLGPKLIPSALSREDVLQGLPIAAESEIFRRVLSRADGGLLPLAKSCAEVSTESGAVQRREGMVGKDTRVCGLLEALMAEITLKSCAVAVDSNTQTEELGRSHKENLDSRLGAARDNWLRRSANERLAPARDVTERMLTYQQECESRAAAQVKAELESFRERDLTALRLQMAASQRREVDAMRKQLQAEYDTRVDRLHEVERERDRRHLERLREVEAAQFEARQQLLREMDLLRGREQEARRGAELDARGVRAEELRLRDLAVSLDGRAEEIRRRERESARSHEDALQAARHEARQAVAGKEESVAREREFLRLEMEAVRAERKACQEQLQQHADTARALQEVRSEAISQDARARVAESEAERLGEHAAVYKEAYERRREVTVDTDNKACVRLGRAELEGRVQSLEEALERERLSSAQALGEALEARDALEAEVRRLRAREDQWEQEATDLSQALAQSEIERDRAERQAEEETCERVALDGQVSELRALLRRSREAIEAIRLCDAEAEASAASAAETAAAAATPRSVGAIMASSDLSVAPAGAGAVTDAADVVSTCPPAPAVRGSTAWLTQETQAWCPDLCVAEGGVVWQDRGALVPAGARVTQEMDIELCTGGKHAGVVAPAFGAQAESSRCWGRRTDRSRGAITMSGFSSDGQVVCSANRDRARSNASANGDFHVTNTAVIRGDNGEPPSLWDKRVEERWRGVGGDRDVSRGDGYGQGCNVAASRTNGRYRRRHGSARRRPGNARRPDSQREDADVYSGDSHERTSDGGDCGRGRVSKSRSCSKAGNRRKRRQVGREAANEHAEAAEPLLTEKRERMASELEAERARSREMEEWRLRQREEERTRREQGEVEEMRRRLEYEEDRAAAAIAAAAAAAVAERRVKSLQLEVDKLKREERERGMITGKENGNGAAVVRRSTVPVGAGVVGTSVLEETCRHGIEGGERLNGESVQLVVPVSEEVSPRAAAAMAVVPFIDIEAVSATAAAEKQKEYFIRRTPKASDAGVLEFTQSSLTARNTSVESLRELHRHTHTSRQRQPQQQKHQKEQEQEQEEQEQLQHRQPQQDGSMTTVDVADGNTEVPPRPGRTIGIVEEIRAPAATAAPASDPGAPASAVATAFSSERVDGPAPSGVVGVLVSGDQGKRVSLPAAVVVNERLCIGGVDYASADVPGVEAKDGATGTAGDGTIFTGNGYGGSEKGDGGGVMDLDSGVDAAGISPGNDGQILPQESQDDARKAQVDHEVREYREKVRERRQQQQQQEQQQRQQQEKQQQRQHQPQNTAFIPRSPIDSDHDLETGDGVQSGDDSAAKEEGRSTGSRHGGTSESEGAAGNDEVGSNSIGGGSIGRSGNGEELSLGGRSVSEASDNDWF